MLTVFWDNDGVLVDTEGLYFQACKQVIGSVGVDLTLGQFKDISLSRGESTFVLVTEQGVDSDTVSRLRKERDRLYADLLESRCPVIDGVEEVLRALYGRVRMGVVTSARRQHFEAAHASSGVIQYMDFVLTREDYTDTKPDPEPYLTAMKRHGLRPEQCIVIEDSERGLAAATAAGLECIIVFSEWTEDGDFTKAAKVVENIHGVPDEVLRRAAAKADGNRTTVQAIARNDITDLEDIPNVGPAIAGNLRLIGIQSPEDILGKDPFKMYDELCDATGAHPDPCVIDVFIAAVRFMAGEPARPWWKYTPERKQALSAKASN